MFIQGILSYSRLRYIYTYVYSRYPVIKVKVHQYIMGILSYLLAVILVTWELMLFLWSSMLSGRVRPTQLSRVFSIMHTGMHI